MESFLDSAVIVALVGAVSGIVGSVLTYLATRSKTIADILVIDRQSLHQEQTALAKEQTAFREMMQEELANVKGQLEAMRQENIALREENASLRERVATLEAQLRGK